jgi:hypothetical protein
LSRFLADLSEQRTFTVLFLILGYPVIKSGDATSAKPPAKAEEPGL